MVRLYTLKRSLSGVTAPAGSSSGSGCGSPTQAGSSEWERGSSRCGEAPAHLLVFLTKIVKPIFFRVGVYL